jgi:predicted ATPase/signal transduction histidine kinase
MHPLAPREPHKSSSLTTRRDEKPFPNIEQVFDPSVYSSETLSEGDIGLARGRAQGKPSVLFLSATGSRPSPEGLARLRRWYDQRFEVGQAGSVPVIALGFRDGRLTLVLRDDGGELLSQLLVGSLQLEKTLVIAAAIARSIARLHRAGLVHRDIKPLNLLVAPDLTQVWLVGLGLHCRALDSVALSATNEITGTVAYMSPEQTGRIERPVDQRSDLYAFGVTLYEMLTGSLPFGDGDSADIMHHHVATTPIPVSEVVDVPPAVSGIVSKLLAKAPSDRYQTGESLASDLDRCLASWRLTGKIDDFALGEDDGLLAMPDGRLQGREAEVAALDAALQDTIASKTVSLTLLSGYSGIGKTSVVEAFRLSQAEPMLFASAKCDPFVPDAPYAILRFALADLSAAAIGQDGATREELKGRLAAAGIENVGLVSELVPALKQLVASEFISTEVPPAEAKVRLFAALTSVVQAFASGGSPLVLFFDDLQWVDGGTLEFLSHLLKQSNPGPILLIGVYRENEVGPGHPLRRRLIDGEEGHCLREIRLQPLDRSDVAAMIATKLQLSLDSVRELADEIQSKSQGNPFFSLQVLATLLGRGIIERNSAGVWCWDISDVRAIECANNVADLLLERISELSPKAQLLMTRLACLGAELGPESLATVLDWTSKDLEDALQEALWARLLIRSRESFRFPHDRIREAAYALIPLGMRSAVHFRLGQQLRQVSKVDVDADFQFEIVEQLNRGADQITSAEDKLMLVQLNLRAGNQARAATAYESALIYFRLGQEITGFEPGDCDLSFALGFGRAECEFLIGDADAALEQLERLARLSLSVQQRASLTCQLIEIHTARDRTDSAVEVCLAYLNSVGVAWSAHPEACEISAEYAPLWRELGKREVESLAALPRMSAPEARAMLDVLTAVTPAAFFTDEGLLCLVIGRMANLSLERGISEASPLAFAYLGMLLGPRFDKYAIGMQFAKLALSLTDARPLDWFTARVYLMAGYHVFPWSAHVRTSIPWTRRTFVAAQQTGDIPFACYSRRALVTQLLLLGAPLEQIEEEVDGCLAFVKNAQFGMVADTLIGQKQLVRSLRGLTEKFGRFDEDRFSEAEFENRLSSDRRLAMSECWYWIRRMQARLHSGDLAAALTSLERADALIWIGPSHLESAEYHFYGALVRAAHAETSENEANKVHSEALSRHVSQLQAWSRTSQENFICRAQLAEAELARLSGDDKRAMQLYEAAITSAREQGFVHVEAMANEWAARFYANRGFRTPARAHLEEARSCYLVWGALGKVTQLDAEHSLIARLAVGSRTSISASVESLDLATVVKTSQLVCGEVDLESLISSLMKLALEHAGADRGVLALFHSKKLKLEAEAVSRRDGIEVRMISGDPSSEWLPMGVLGRVESARERLTLRNDDIGKINDDAYFGLVRPKAILCLPIISQAVLVGLLYLENRVTDHAFTARSVAVLDLLAAQAAVSLQNARLYTELKQENRERRAAEEELRVKESSLSIGQRISQTGSWQWNVNSEEMRWSDELFRIFSMDPTVSRPTAAMVMAATHPDDRKRVQETMRRARLGQPFEHEHRIVAGDGSVKIVRAIGKPNTVTGGGYEFDGIVMDMTERRATEEALRGARARLARSSHLTAVGEIAASIIHEINQPLAGIVANADAGLLWLAHAEPQVAEAKAVLERIVKEGSRAADVVRSLRALAKKTNPDIAELDMNSVVTEIIELMGNELQKGGLVTQVDLAYGKSLVRGDHRQLQQVVLNLIRNGIESMDGVTDRDRSLFIRTHLDEREVTVVIEDSGTGVSSDHHDRIFEPLFTTKSAGMGMGLAICKSIIEAHCGRLRVAPRVQHGSAFSFTIPALGFGDRPMQNRAGPSAASGEPDG